MSALTNELSLSPGSLISDLLCAVKKELQDVARGERASIGLNQNEAAALEQGAFEVLRLIRSLRNRLAPINKIPPEILTLVPDFWNRYSKGDRQLIALTHVCRTWREMFISRSCLWTPFSCKSGHKTRVYLERSISSPINVSLDRSCVLSPRDPFFQIIPHAIGRLKSLSIDGNPGKPQDVITHLSLPAPLLEKLSIKSGYEGMVQYGPMLTTEIFDGDLSSLRKLCLQGVRTELPWRNMVNLTSFTLAHTVPNEVTVKRLLDFFESAPRLRKIQLRDATPTSGAQNGRLVSLACLEWMDVLQGGPSSLLLNHLLIPVGAKLVAMVDLLGSFPKSLDRIFSNLTRIHLFIHDYYPRVRFGGPHGLVDMVPGTPQINSTLSVLESLARFDTSKTKWLEVHGADSSSRDLLYQILLPMKALRTLVISRSKNSHIFMNALQLGMSSSEVEVCPKLENLILVYPVTMETFDVKDVIRMAAARASRGAKLKSVKFVCDVMEFMKIDLLELKNHVLHMEYGPNVVEPYYGDYSTDWDD